MYLQDHSYGLYSYGSRSYGLYSNGLYSNGLYSYGPYTMEQRVWMHNVPAATSQLIPNHIGRYK